VVSFQFTDKRAVTVGDGIDFVLSVENFQFLGNAPGQQVLTLADLLGIPNTDVTPTAWGWTNEDTDNAPNADGTPDVDGFIVNSATTAGIQRNVSVSDSVGEFVAVAWEQAATPGADTHIRGQSSTSCSAPDGFMPNTMNLSDGARHRDQCRDRFWRLPTPAGASCLNSAITLLTRRASSVRTSWAPDSRQARAFGSGGSQCRPARRRDLRLNARPHAAEPGWGLCAAHRHERRL